MLKKKFHITIMVMLSIVLLGLSSGITFAASQINYSAVLSDYDDVSVILESYDGKWQVSAGFMSGVVGYVSNPNNYDQIKSLIDSAKSRSGVRVIKLRDSSGNTLKSW